MEAATAMKVEFPAEEELAEENAGKSNLRSALVHHGNETQMGTLLGACHNDFLIGKDPDGFSWSMRLLQGLLKGTSSQDWSNWLVFPSEGEESSKAFVHFHSAKHASLKGKSGIAVKGFIECYHEARTKSLKYEAANGAGMAFWEQQEYFHALKWFTFGRLYASGEAALVATYNMGRCRAALKNFKVAEAFFRSLQGVGSRLASALAMMLGADVKYFDSSHDRKGVVLAYLEARLLLIRFCMPALRTELAKYLSLDQCPDVAVKLLRRTFDGFSGRWESRKDTIEQALQVSSFFFAHELYAYSRKRILYLQQYVMDPRPYFEQAYVDIMVGRMEKLDNLKRCHQISFETGDMYCFDMARRLLDLGINEGNDDAIFSILVACFGGDVEDPPEAWAAYHVGVSKWLYKMELPTEEVATVCQYKRLKWCLEEAKTPALKSLATHALAKSCSDDHGEETELIFLERAKHYALDSCNLGLIMLTFRDLFELEARHRNHEGMKMLQEELSNVGEKYPDAPCLQALSLYMEGRLLIDVEADTMQQFLYEAEALIAVSPQPDDYLLSDVNKRPNLEEVVLKNTFSQASRWLMTSQSITLELDAHQDEILKDWSLTLARENMSPQVRRSLCQLVEGMSKINEEIKNTLVEGEDKLEKVEEQAAFLLYKIEQHEERYKVEFVQARYDLLISLARLSARYYVQERGLESGNTCTESDELQQSVTELVNVFHEACMSMDRETRSASLGTLDSWSRCFLKMQRADLAWERMLEFFEELIQEDTKFGSFSKGRIPFLDSCKFLLRRMQLFQWGLYGGPGNVQAALIWSERERARDFFYRLTKNAKVGKQYLDDLHRFDTKDDEAWKEINELLLDMEKQQTVLLVMSATQQNKFWHLLTFFLHGDFVTSRIHYRPQPLSGSKLFGLIKEQMESSLARAEELENEIITHCSEWFEVLIRPYTEYLERFKPRKIIFVPSEEVCTFPFGLLYDKTKKRHLIQDYAVAMVSSLRLLKQCEKIKAELEKSCCEDSINSLPSLLVEDPTENLPSAEEEAEFVSDTLTGCRREVSHLRKEHATKQAVLGKLASSEWVHIIAHGIVDDNNYPDGALILANEDLLSSDEIVEHLRESNMKTRAAVLSACSSGKGRVFSEGILALPRSFHMCGVPSVVVSLWNVDDDSTYRLMEKFYTNFSKDDEEAMDIAEALQLATKEMMEAVHPFTEQPLRTWQWAPFVISGCCSTRFHCKKNPSTELH